MRTYWTCVVMVSITLTATAQTDQQKRCESACGKQLPTAGRTLVLDANTGQRIGGKTTFSEGDAVQVVIRNRNPFRYEYGYSSESRPLDIDVAQQFLSGIPGFTAANKAIANIANVAASPNLAPQAPSCPGAEAEWDALVAGVKPLLDNSTALKERVKAKADAAQAYADFLELTKGPVIEEADCANVCKAAADLQKLLPTLLNLSDDEKLIDKLKDAVSTAPALLKAFEDKFAKLTDVQKENCAVDGDLKAIKDLLAAASTYATSVKDLQARAAEFRKFQQIVDTVMSSENSFREVRVEEQLDGPTGITIQLTRRDLRTENATLERFQPVHVTIGEGALSISGGIFFSTLEDIQVTRVKSDDGGKIVDRFAEESNSNVRPAIAVLLNARIAETKTFFGWGSIPGNLAISTGVILVNRNGTNETEYLIGPSWLLARRAVTLTLAAHVGRVAHIGGDFKPGDIIPAGLTDPLPVDHDWQTGIAFGVTYRTR